MNKYRINGTLILLVLVALTALLVTGCGSQAVSRVSAMDPDHMVEHHDEGHGHEVEQHAEEQDHTTESLASAIPDVSFTLRTDLTNGLAFVGVGGSIDGVANPTLEVQPGDIVQVTLVNGDDIEHDVAFSNFNIHSSHVVAKGDSTTIIFRADEAGSFLYHCSLPGHRQAGMEGRLIIEEG